MAENGPFGTPFLTPRNPEKVYVGPFSCPGNEKLFLWAQIGGVLGGGQEESVEKVEVLFPSPKEIR